MGAWTWLGAYLSALVGTVGCGLSLDSACVAQQAAGFGWSVPAGIAVLGGVSLMGGQWALLAINRVGRWRALLTLAISGIGTLLTGAIEALLVAACGWLMLGHSPRLIVLLPRVLIALAPYWLGFLVVLPYTGPGVARILKVWHLLVLWQLLRPVLDASGANALLVAGIAWLAAQAFDVVVDRSPLRLRERLFRLVSGSPGWTGRDLMASAEMEQTR